MENERVAIFIYAFRNKNHVVRRYIVFESLSWPLKHFILVQLKTFRMADNKWAERDSGQGSVSNPSVHSHHSGNSGSNSHIQLHHHHHIHHHHHHGRSSSIGSSNGVPNLNRGAGPLAGVTTVTTAAVMAQQHSTSSVNQVIVGNQQHEPIDKFNRKTQ